MTTASIPPNEEQGGQLPPPAPANVEALLAQASVLRAEAEATEDASTRSVLLHEIGTLLERAGDDPAAAKEYLGAFNGDQEFREPLEALVSLLHRRKSVKNLGKLLDALVRAATTPEESGRALLAKAAFLLELHGDAAGSRDTLREAVGENPEESGAWLELEILAGKEADKQARIEALAERAQRAEPPTWRALLMLDLAELLLAVGDKEKAADMCRSAAALEGGARFRAYVVLAEMARREGDEVLLAEALEAQAELVATGLDDAASADADGVPKHARTAAFVVDALLRASDLRRKQGQLDDASRLLERAAAKMPSEGVLLWAQLSLAEAKGDLAKGAQIAKTLLESGVSGAEGAALLMRVEQEAEAQGDRAAVIDALAKASEADPASVPVRALLQDFLAIRAEGGGDDAAKDGALLAGSIESAAEQFSSDGAKARAYLRAAWEWATLAKDVGAAKAALSLAASHGVAAATIARLSRTLAALTGDGAWYDEATRRVLSSGAGEHEQSGLWLELLRGRLLRGEKDSAAKAVEQLTTAPGGAWLGRVLSAYALPFAAKPSEAPAEPPAEGAEAPAKPADKVSLPAAALDALAEVESEQELSKALSFVAAVRAHREGDLDGTRRRLESLLSADAGHLVAGLYMAELQRAAGDVAGTASTLSSVAAATEDQALAAALSLESALLLWGAGKREEALAAVRVAKGASNAAASAMLLWATRGVEPASGEGRRKALELAHEGGEDASLLALERFGLEVSPGGDAEEARNALDALDQSALADVGLSSSLARAIYPGALDNRPQLDDALSRLAETGDAGASFAAAERTRIARDVDENRPEQLRQAEGWATVDPTAASALEWLSASLATEDLGAEISSLRLLAQQLAGEARSSVEAHATKIQWLTSEVLPPLVPSVDPAVQLINLELAPAGCDPRRRAAALRGLGGALGEAASFDALALAGWSDLAAGDAQAAMSAFREVVAKRPNDICSFEGLRTAAMTVANVEAQAEACARLGELCNDDGRAGVFWEEAGFLWLDTLKNEQKGEWALLNAFNRNPSLARAFDRLFRRVRDRKDDQGVLELASRRLEFTNDNAEIVKLYWEQARVLHKRGNLQQALEVLDNVTLLEEDHIGALTLKGDAYIKQSMFQEAAETYARLSSLKDFPGQQRLQAGMGAVELYEKRLNQPKSALDVLMALHKAGISTPQVRERIAQVATKAGAWREATAMLEELMLERDTSEGRITAARLSMAIWRDKVSEPLNAKRAVVRLLEESPGDGEALDLVLATDFQASMKEHALGHGKTAIVQALARGALEGDSVARLAKIAKATEDPALLQAALGALVSLRGDEAGASEQLHSLDQRAAKVPQVQIDAKVLAAIGDAADTGPLVHLFEILGATIGEALGPTKEALNVGRKEKVDPRSGLPLRNDIAAWAGALGLGEFELYVGGKDPNGVQGVAGEIPALVVGSQVTSPLSAAHRSAIARELFALKRGITVVRTRDEATVGAIAVAACKLFDGHLDAPPFAILGDVQRLLQKALPSLPWAGVNKTLREYVPQVAQARPDVLAWAKAVQRSLDRMSIIAAGDVSIVLADLLGTARGDVRRSLSGNDRAERLLRFVLSPQYLELRNRLGMGVR